MSLDVLTQPYTTVLDEFTVWQQGNALTGNTLPGWSEDWEVNVKEAIYNLGAYTTAKQIIRISPTRNPAQLRDISNDALADIVINPLRAESVITTNPDHILFVNPADCGEIAVQGTASNGQQAIGLFHADRHQVAKQGYMPSLDYFWTRYDILPGETTVRVSPSARAESYAFADIAPEQKTALRWKEYVWQDAQGLWHVDLHERMLADLRAAGIADENMMISPDDTAHLDSPYFSYSQSVKGNKIDGGNGLFFALR